jgi:hypothetical protein
MTDRSSAERLAHDALTALTDLAQALRTLDVVDQGRRKTEQARHQVESLVSTLRNVGATLDNLHQLSTRVTALLDEIEEPVKKLAVVADQLGPMIAILGMKPPAATPSTSAPSAATPASATTSASATSASALSASAPSAAATPPSPASTGTGTTDSSAG